MLFRCVRKLFTKNFPDFIHRNMKPLAIDTASADIIRIFRLENSFCSWHELLFLQIKSRREIEFKKAPRSEIGPGAERSEQFFPNAENQFRKKQWSKAFYTPSSMA